MEIDLINAIDRLIKLEVEELDNRFRIFYSMIRKVYALCCSIQSWSGSKRAEITQL